ncbi:MAG: hypothetical protein LLF92_03360 [Planctomycetaceae bacterium]|nr:hypothetical protein [Planctomycetaceae bacterium]
MNINYKKIDERLIRFEFQAISEIYKSWAEADKDKLAKTYKKLLSYRRYILGIENPIYKKGKDKALSRETIPHEITQDEYDLCYEAVKQARKDLRNNSLEDLTIEHEIVDSKGSSLKILVPFPLPVYDKDCLVSLGRSIPKNSSSSTPPSTLAYEIVGKRLNINAETVIKHRKLKSRCEKTKRSWQLLATSFLELNFYKDTKTQARILDCLLLSGYSRFKLYYLIQISHSIDWQMSLRRWDVATIDSLCNAVCPDIKDGPFAKLMQA